jgi:hypothetical protein
MTLPWRLEDENTPEARQRRQQSDCLPFSFPFLKKPLPFYMQTLLSVLLVYTFLDLFWIIFPSVSVLSAFAQRLMPRLPPFSFHIFPSASGMANSWCFLGGDLRL